MIISDGVFSKSRKLISNNRIKPKYNNTLAIRGKILKNLYNINDKNISLFLDSHFHQVLYPVDSSGNFNFIAIMKYHLTKDELENYQLFDENAFIKKVLAKFPKNSDEVFNNIKDLKVFPVFVSRDFYHLQNKNIFIIGDAFFAFPPSFAQGASQSIEAAYGLFKSIENKTENNFFIDRIKKTKMVNNRSRFNQYAFHMSNPFAIFIRNIFLKRLVKNQKFLERYLGKIYRN